MKRNFVCLLTVAAMLVGMHAARAANHTVSMANFAFSPSPLKIAVGDTVTWTNTAANAHTSSSSADTTCTTDGRWDSLSIAAHLAYSITFTNYPAGTNNYVCTLHCSLFSMKGVLIITNGPNVAPTVTVTNPTAGTVFAAPANVTIGANAADTDGSVTNVQFRVNSTILSNDSAAPYFAVTNNMPAGNYTLTAIAADNLGATSTNSVSIIVNALPSISITNPLAGAAFLAPTKVVLKAAASDADGSITNVQFFSGAASIGNVTNAPFNFTNNNLAAGNYTFTAKAQDNFGGATTSAAVNVFLLTNSTLESPARLENGELVFTLSGIAGQTYITEGSTNLFDWIPITTNLAPATLFNITNSGATNFPMRFYRARQDF